MFIFQFANMKRKESTSVEGNTISANNNINNAVPNPKVTPEINNEIGESVNLKPETKEKIDRCDTIGEALIMINDNEEDGIAKAKEYFNKFGEVTGMTQDQIADAWQLIENYLNQYNQQKITKEMSPAEKEQLTRMMADKNQELATESAKDSQDAIDALEDGRLGEVIPRINKEDNA